MRRARHHRSRRRGGVLQGEQGRLRGGRSRGAAGRRHRRTISKPRGCARFGPSKAAARLEGSKGFTKDLCGAHDIPTGAYQRFTAAEPAKAYARKQATPIVIKADGLAAGKGVIIAETIAEAEAAIDMMFGGGLGDAGAEVVIEEFLRGEEASFFALCDGETAIPLASAQDHKRAFDNDKGPNTGGMGAYSPAPVMTAEMSRRTMDEIVLPTVRAMKADGRAVPAASCSPA